MKIIMNMAVIIAVLVTCSPIVRAQARNDEGNIDLSVDQFVPGGLNSGKTSTELLPAFAAAAPGLPHDEAIKFAFNYDIPRLVVSYRNSKTGKRYQRTGKLAKGENLVGVVRSRVSDGDSWKVTVDVRWLEQCGNPLPYPFQASIWIPKGPGPETITRTVTNTVIRRVEVPKPFAVLVDHNVIVQQIVPSVGDINITVPPAERGRYHLTVVGNMEAGQRWETQKDLWDNVLDFFRVAAYPIGELIHRAPSLAVNNSNSNSATGNGGAGGIGEAAAAAAASSAASTSSTAVTPTSGAGTSGDSSAGSSAGSDGSHSGSQ